MLYVLGTNSKHMDHLDLHAQSHHPLALPLAEPSLGREEEEVKNQLVADGVEVVRVGIGAVAQSHLLGPDFGRKQDLKGWLAGPVGSVHGSERPYLGHDDVPRRGGEEVGEVGEGPLSEVSFNTLI